MERIGRDVPVVCTRSRSLALATLVTAAGLLASASGAAPAAAVEGKESAATYAAHMALLHEGDKPVATAAAEPEPRQPVVTEKVVYAAGKSPGYLARPEAAAGPMPGLIVIHEWWGLNENIQAVTRRLAGEGYVALAVDLYGGEVAAEREDAMRLMSAAMSDPDSALQNLEAAFQYLSTKGAATKVGVVGWCFGGAWSLQTAILLGDRLDAAVVYYGRLVTDTAELEKISAPLLGFFGSADRSIPVASVKGFEESMKKLGKSVEVHVYEGADHAFANPSGTRYEAVAAEDAWRRATEFFAAHLQ